MGRLSEDKVAEQVRKHRGNLATVARAFKVTRQAVSEYVHRRESLKAVLAEARASMVDAVESRFYDDCLKDNPAYQTSRIFFLKTQGKDRGYVERQEHEHFGQGGGPMVVEVKIEHHTAAKEHVTAGGGGRGPIDVEVSPGPEPRVVVNGKVPVGTRRDALG